MTIAWSFGGTTLATFGKVTLYNDSYDLAPVRGEDIVLPFNHGKKFVTKYFDARTLSFVIKYQGTSIGGVETINDTLKTLLASRALQTLSQTRTDATVRTIQASVNQPLQMDLSNGNNVVFFTFEFDCPFPFFRLSTAIADNTTTINATPKSMTVTNPGTVEERDATIILTGPLSNTVITNSTNGCTLTYTGTIASPRIVTISKATTGEYVATNDLGTNVIGNITHSGASALMVFNPGANSLSITDGTHSTGTIKVSFYAPYL